MLKVKLLHPAAKLPVVAHPGEDIAIDLFSREHAIVSPGATEAFHTGIAIEFEPPAGAVLATRSSQAKNGISVEGGQIDGGYRGEIVVMLYNQSAWPYTVEVGDKIAQLKKQPIFDDVVEEVAELTSSKREAKGFGSTGR